MGPMSRGEESKRWRIGIRGILYFTTAIAVSLALLRFSFEKRPTLPGSWPGAWPPRVQLAALFTGMFTFGAAIGGLIGRLGSGTAYGCHVGFWVGGMAGLYLLWALLP